MPASTLPRFTGLDDNGLLGNCALVRERSVI
jgi:hypothetical protein